MPYRKTHPREFASWKHMMGRCYRVTDKRYPEWGGRGIRVCDRWHDFLCFYADMGARPEGTTIEREDNDGDYTPDNCRWATAAEQVRNRGNTIHVTLSGVTRCLKDWCVELGLNYQTVYMRIARGRMTPEAALATPLHKGRRARS